MFTLKPVSSTSMLSILNRLPPHPEFRASVGNRGFLVLPERVFPDLYVPLKLLAKDLKALTGTVHWCQEASSVLSKHHVGLWKFDQVREACVAMEGNMTAIVTPLLFFCSRCGTSIISHSFLHLQAYFTHLQSCPQSQQIYTRWKAWQAKPFITAEELNRRFPLSLSDAGLLPCSHDPVLRDIPTHFHCTPYWANFLQQVGAMDSFWVLKPFCVR